jgi:ATP-binding cassette subfamily F protein uup
MAIQISAHKLTKIFSSKTLFDELTFSIESGQRIGLIGPNGAGKSTLLKILAGKSDLDGGTLSIQRGLKIGFLEQVPHFSEEATVHSSVMEGSHDPYDWEEISRADEIMSKLSLTEGEVNPETLISSLSGGWKKRVALARELIKQPDLLLLDEPTNHLDIESILWLENLLAKSNFATITITHDRLFLQKVSNKIFELDRRHPDGLLKIDGDYAKYLEVRSDLLSAQEQHETKLKNTLRRETEWLRRGPQARLKKQQARIDQAGELKGQVEDLTDRNRVQKVEMQLQGMEKNPKKLIEAKNISKKYGSNVVIPPIDLLLTPKSRIGLIGSNGCGKSTLIKLLTAKEKSDTGSVHHADQLQVVYFEQNRESLDQELTVLKTVCPAGEFVPYGNNGTMHVKSYLQRFLFSYEQMDMPVRKLSGGEQSRLLLAKLLLKKANVLILDEPTNDLDISTLDVLQEILGEFNGAIILVTHDRYFLDQASNLFLAFGIDKDGKKTITPMVGLDQWEEWHEAQTNLKTKLKSAAKTTTATATSGKKKKLSFNDQYELDHMDENIKKAENLLAELTEESVKPENISNSKKIIEITEKMGKAQAEIERLYKKWEELTTE